MKIELFFAPTCERCAANRANLEAVARQVAGMVEWEEIDVTKNVDYAVQLGILSPPAMAIDGELVFPALPTEKQLRAELERRVSRS
jgi:thioredoxin 1